MVQLPSMGKRQHAETAEPAMGPPPPPPLVSAAAVKVEAEEIGYAGQGPFSKRAKAAQPAPPPQQVDPFAVAAFSVLRVCLGPSWIQRGVNRVRRQAREV
jgi:hypothetical protein